MKLTPEQYEAYLLSRADEAIAKYGAANRISVITAVRLTAPCSLAEAVRVVNAATK